VNQNSFVSFILASTHNKIDEKNVEFESDETQLLEYTSDETQLLEYTSDKRESFKSNSYQLITEEDINKLNGINWLNDAVSY